MYPRVKVRNQDHDDRLSGFNLETSLRSLRGLESLCIDDLDSPVGEWGDDSPPSVVRIPSSYIPSTDTSTVLSSKVAVKSNYQKKAMDSKPNIRASSVPRPRAVLSSPDNDRMIGSKNRTQLLSGLKSHNSCQGRHIRCKLIPKQVDTETPVVSRKETKEAAGIENDFRDRKGRVLPNSSRRAHLTRGTQDPF